MTLFRVFLVTIILVVNIYTAVVIANHGMGLYPIFFGDIAAMTWPGQFNLDFLGFLLMSGLWVAWRHAFSAGGLILGIAAFNLGARGGQVALHHRTRSATWGQDAISEQFNREWHFLPKC